MRATSFCILPVVILGGSAPLQACNSECTKTDMPIWYAIPLFAVYLVLAYLWDWYKSPPAGVGFDPNDPDKLAAEREAKRTLPQFWTAFEKPALNECDFAVKFNLTPHKNAELIWAVNLRWQDGRLFGMLANEPLEPGYEPDRHYEIDPALIVDWSYTKDGVVQGHYITRAMFRKMPKRFVKQAIKEFGWQSA